MFVVLLLIKFLGKIDARLVSLDLLEVGVLSLSTQTMGLGPETIFFPFSRRCCQSDRFLVSRKGCPWYQIGPFCASFRLVRSGVYYLASFSVYVIVESPRLRMHVSFFMALVFSDFRSLVRFSGVFISLC
jgi:hypothetical protein